MSQVNKEFEGPSELTKMDRRSFMKNMGLFSSMSFLANCSRPADKIFPFAREIPEFSRHSVDQYTSVISSQGFAQGIVVKSFEGRPIKIEGHPDHAFSRGATTPEAQSALYDLYHPSRLQGAEVRGKKVSISEVRKLLRDESLNWDQGQELLFLYPPYHSPTQNELIKKIKQKFPKSSWLSMAPWKKEFFSTANLKEADYVLSFDEDLFQGRPDALALTHDFMKRRKAGIDQTVGVLKNTLEVFESSPLLTGAKADEVTSLAPSEIWKLAVDLQKTLKGSASGTQTAKKLAKKLHSAKHPVVFISESLHPDAKTLEEDINRILRNSYETRSFPLPDTCTFEQMLSGMQQGTFKIVMSFDVDPAYWYKDFAEAYEKVKTKIHLSLFEDETSKLANIRIARSHFLEAWSDLASVDGKVSIQQPLIEPIFHSLSPVCYLSSLLNEDKTSYELVYETHKAHWKESLLKGVTPVVLGVSSRRAWKSLGESKSTSGFSIKLIPDPSLGFGASDLNPILQELPKNFSRLTWRNAYYLNEKDAKELNLSLGDVIEVRTKTSAAEGPIMILPRVAPKTIVATLGYGKSGRGTNNFVFGQGDTIEIKKLGKKMDLALTQENLFPKERSPIQLADLPHKEKEPKKLASLYPKHPLPHQAKGPQWGMTIDLTTCTGCQACVLACQVENNVPFVGENQVMKGRILHWLRVDTYHVDNKTFFQPVPCMHCEKAPCEVVCPVNATVHGQGGLNEMVYNRCVGTRYCSNNCPYRVRKFNFKAYSVLKSPYNLGFNPSVSVRDRGVMEKCTYCIQRISDGLHQGAPGRVKTACQQVCPSEAIVFGDIEDKNSQVAKEKASARNYDLLEDEGTVPRTSYLKVIRS